MDPQALRTLWKQSVVGEQGDPNATYKLPEALDETEQVDDPTMDPFALSVTWAGSEDDEPTDAGAAAYVVRDELGRGGMAVVYRAEQRRLRRDVAFKMAQDQRGSGQRFVSEARVAGMLDHPNIVPVHDLITTDDGTLALAMRLVDGVSWDEKLNAAATDAEPWFLEDHVHALIAVAHAVDFAHERGVVHCDLKPDNVMIGEHGEIVLMDWGCALSISDSGALVAPRASKLRAPLGTPVYMAPELALARAEDIGPATDVYLLGGILHRVLTGRAPHRGENFYAVVSAAASGADLALDGVSPPDLAAIATKALAPNPADRFASAREFRKALERWLRTHESEQLAREARAVLAASEAALNDLASAAQTDRSGLYLDIEDALAGFAQAQRLWTGNTAAAEDEHRARLLVAGAAIAAGDLNFAEAHLRRLTKGSDRTALEERLGDARAELDAQASRHRWTRRALVGAVAAVALTTTVGYLAARYEADLAAQNEMIARARLEEIQRLSDHEVLNTLSTRATTLYPSLPKQTAALVTWLDEAEALIANIPGHQEQLAELRSQSASSADGEYGFTQHTIQWEHDTMAELLEGMLAMRDGLVPDVERRLAFAKTVEERSIEQHRATWDETIAYVASDPAYGGLDLSPQIGLVPLGPDPATGLVEFAHLATGAVPARSAEGVLAVDESHGVVLILIPGGTATMGATPGPAGPSRDPSAHEHEGPVHQVPLSPFLIGKYEITQAQWERVMGNNPAAYPPGKEVGGNMHTAAHPIEQVRWSETMEMMRRVGLTLPTEAQWEYAARAGTTTVFWTGNSPRSLQGAANIADHYGMTHEGPESWHWESWLEDGYLTHAPVGSYRANAFGLHDTAGNVWEWCLDRFGEYTAPTAPGNGARETDEEAARVFRGGGFRASTVHARSADRYSLYATDYRAYDVGGRAAMVIE